jgi:hypothetical protein
MQNAETVLGVLRERGGRGLPLDELYRQLFNPQLYLTAYGRIYSNKGAMTPGASGETADGMSLGRIESIIDAMRHERYRFQPVKRVYIPKKNGRLRPFTLPTARAISLSRIRNTSIGANPGITPSGRLQAGFPGPSNSGRGRSGVDSKKLTPSGYFWRPAA